ncbi:MAG: PEP-CTERM sorting domain-containing protein [Sphingomonadales bacterium]|nr:PEP-CTERM sorting domain-containing protein [Sphingomonadales bacterium]
MSSAVSCFIRLFSFLLTNEEAVALGFSSVPEPSSWAMMIGGFGLVGGAMRKRRRRTQHSYF